MQDRTYYEVKFRDYPDVVTKKDFLVMLDTAYGFLTRGCPNNCGFCSVCEKEGRISHKVADLSEWWNQLRHH